MGREERPLLLAEVLDRVAHRGIVAAAPDGPQPPGGCAISSTSVAARRDRFGALRAPPFALRRRPRSRSPRSRSTVRSKSGTTIAGWPRSGIGRLVGPHQVDLGPVAFEPGVVVGQVRGRVDLGEAEHRPELGGAPEVGRIDLEHDVVEHGPRIRPARASEKQRDERRGDDDRGRPGDRLGGDLHVEPVGVGDDQRVEARGHRRHQQVGGRQVDQRRRQRQQDERGRPRAGRGARPSTGRVSGGGIGSSPSSAFSARVAPTAKNPIGRIAMTSAWEASTRNSGASAARGQQAGDRRVERRVAGEEGTHPLARALAGAVAEGGADGKGAEQQRTGR